MTQYFYETHDSNPVIFKLASVTKSDTPTIVSHMTFLNIDWKERKRNIHGLNKETYNLNLFV